MKLECFKFYPDPPPLVPGKLARPWMDNVSGRVPYRCLPMVMANQTGWEILCKAPFQAYWNGGDATSDILIKSDWPGNPISHFAYGILTFHTGYVFRTEPGYSLSVSGAPNHIKDGIQALSGIVETEWLPFTFTMNWKFTRPGMIRFEKDEPFCFINVVPNDLADTVEPVLKELREDPELEKQAMYWAESRAKFNAAVLAGDPDAVKRSWQKDYFRGVNQATGCPFEEHINKRRMKEPK